MNPANGHMFFSDDSDREVTELNPGPDGRYGTPDDIITEFSTRNFSPAANDPEGVAYAPPINALFVVDGVNNEVYHVQTGANGIFDGPPADGGDDIVTSFDTANVMLRPGGYIPGPTQFSSADGALWYLVFGALDKFEPMALTSELSIRYLRPAVGKTLYARADLDRIGRRQLVGTVRVWVDDNQAKPCATAQGTYMLPG